MNVFFHVVTGIGIAVAVTDTERLNKIKDSFIPAFCALLLGIVAHGVLDYLPHTYPFSTMLDVLISVPIIGLCIVKAKRKYRLILITAFLGCILPDLVDLLPSILHKYWGFRLPAYDTVFLFHMKEYSGSIFKGESFSSDINHISVIMATAILIWCRKRDFLNIFR